MKHDLYNNGRITCFKANLISFMRYDNQFSYAISGKTHFERKHTNINTKKVITLYLYNLTISSHYVINLTYNTWNKIYLLHHTLVKLHNKNGRIFIQKYYSNFEQTDTEVLLLLLNTACTI